jgi:chondroitin AC lyase
MGRLSALPGLEHSSRGYLFPEGGAIRASNAPVTGSWKEINANHSDEPIVQDVFKLWIEHGVPSDAASYQYVVRPGVDRVAFDAYAADVPIRVLLNTAEIQAVTHGGLGVTGAVFYEPGVLSLASGAAIEVDQPVALLLEEGAGGAQLTLSSPEQNTGPVRVRFSFQAGNGSPERHEMSVSLPGGNRAGASISIRIEPTKENEKITMMP